MWAMGLCFKACMCVVATTEQSQHSVISFSITTNTRAATLEVWSPRTCPGFLSFPKESVFKKRGGGGVYQWLYSNFLQVFTNLLRLKSRYFQINNNSLQSPPQTLYPQPLTNKQKGKVLYDILWNSTSLSRGWGLETGRKSSGPGGRGPKFSLFSSAEGLRGLWESCHFCPTVCLSSSSRLCYVILDKLLNHPLSRFPHLLNEEAVCKLAKIQGAKAWGVLG